MQGIITEVSSYQKNLTKSAEIKQFFQNKISGRLKHTTVTLR